VIRRRDLRSTASRRLGPTTQRHTPTVMAGTTVKPKPGQNGLAVNQDVLTAITTDPRLTF
jgi:hypothetical protein